MFGWKIKIKNKFNGLKLVSILSVIALLSGFNKFDINSNEAEIDFLLFFIIWVGIGLYFLGKRRKLKKTIKGSKVYEFILFSIVLIFLTLSLISGSWYEDPLVFFITPIWILASYFYVLSYEG